LDFSKGISEALAVGDVVCECLERSSKTIQRLVVPVPVKIIVPFLECWCWLLAVKEWMALGQGREEGEGD